MAVTALSAVPPALSTEPSREEPLDAQALEVALTPNRVSLEEERDAWLRDLERLKDYATQLPSEVQVVTVFGSARTRDEPEDIFYQLAREVGAELARSSVFNAQLGDELVPRTGAGPGNMAAPMQGFLETLEAMGALPEGLNADALRTQGVGIRLPHEQELDPRVQLALELETFGVRQDLGLMGAEGAGESAGYIITPGGFGTFYEWMDIAFESVRGVRPDPVVAVGDFWLPLVDALRSVAVEGQGGRGLISQREWAQLPHVGNDVERAVDLVEADAALDDREEPLDLMADRIATQLSRGTQLLAQLPRAISLVGGRRLKADDPAVAVLRQAAEELTRMGFPLRVGSARSVAVAATEGARAVSDDAKVQGFPMRSARLGNIPGLNVQMRVHDSAVYRQLNSRSIRGMVALPGDLEALAQLFGYLTEVQTHKVPRMPIVLVGSDYWKPVWEGLRQTMLENGVRQTIAPEDLDLVTITDDPAEVARVFAASIQGPLDVEGQKKAAAELAVSRFVRSGAKVGLGTGSTTRYAVDAVGARLASGELKDLEAVSTSRRTTEQALALNIPLKDLAALPRLDVAIDGADEVDPHGNLIKGGGGAAKREREVAQAAKRFVVVVDQSKLSPRLGTRFPVPIDVKASDWEAVARRVRLAMDELGYSPEQFTLTRREKDGQPFVTDNGDYILDCKVEGGIRDVRAFAEILEPIPGVTSHGLFLGMATEVVVAHANGEVDVLTPSFDTTFSLSARGLR